MPITDFHQQVYDLTSKIPAGKVSTYGGIAGAMGRPGAARAVGNALNRNPYAPKVPCHRVVRSDGRIGGFAGGIQRKVDMLKKEGVSINGGRTDLAQHGHSFSSAPTPPVGLGGKMRI